MGQTVRSAEELAGLVKETGILPAFKNEIHGFSAEGHIAPEYWFPKTGADEKTAAKLIG